MKFLTCALTASIALAALATPCQADDHPEIVEELKCFIMPKRDVKGKKVFDYKGAKLYLCCSSCVRRMTKTPEKYEAGANHQVVQTGQFVQAACPVSGDAVTDSSPELEIDKAMVKFHSEAHMESIAKLELKEQIETVFGPEGFKKGQFALVEQPETE